MTAKAESVDMSDRADAGAIVATMAAARTTRTERRLRNGEQAPAP